MTPFTHLNAALEEADYLAAKTRQRMALVALSSRYHVLPVTRAIKRGLVVLEIITPSTLARRTTA